MPYTRNFSDTGNFDGVLQKNASFFPESHSVTWLGTRTGEKVPDWRSKIRDGKDATSAYFTDRYFLKDSKAGDVTLIAYIPGNPGAGTQLRRWKGWGFPPPDRLTHLLPDQATAEAESLRRIFQKIRQEYQHWAGASALVEFGDVLHQFGHPFRSIIDLTNRRLNRLQLAARGLSGSTVFKKAKMHEIIASTWLEYAFGLAPLISDTRKAAEALARWQFENTEDFHPRSKAVGRGTSDIATHSTQVGAPGGDWILGTNVTVTRSTRKVQYVCGLDGTVNAAFGSNDRLISLLGFRPIDWIPAVWEAVPWSWLADYFTNLGDILAAAATLTGGVTWVSKSVTDETIRTSVMSVSKQLTANFVSNSGWTLQSLTGTSLGASSLIRSTSTRSVGVQLSVPPLVFQLPSQIGQLANMAAVLMQRRPQASALWLT